MDGDFGSAGLGKRPQKAEKPWEKKELKNAPRASQVKNTAPAPVQISAEQILREASDRGGLFLKRVNGGLFLKERIVFRK